MKATINLDGTVEIEGEPNDLAAFAKQLRSGHTEAPEPPKKRGRKKAEPVRVEVGKVAMETAQFVSGRYPNEVLTKEVADNFGIHDSSANYRLRAAVEANLIQEVGRGRYLGGPKPGMLTQPPSEDGTPPWIPSDGSDSPQP